MEILLDIELTPLPKRKSKPPPEPEWTPETDTLFDGEYTGRLVKWKGKTILIGRLWVWTYSDRRVYLVSVDGGKVKWCPEEWVIKWCDG